MIYVTHDQIEALTLADRIAVMKDRKIQQIGTPEEIYLRPANRFVASFVGSPAMNFFSGHLVHESGRTLFQGDGLRIPVAGDGADLPNRAEVELGIRPEHVFVANGDADGLDAMVEIIEPMGSEKLAWTRVGTSRLSVRLPEETPVAIGDRLRLQVPAHRLNLFDAASGRRL